MVVVFVSPFYDPEIFIAELSRRMPEIPIFGCTTAGELSPGGWDEDSVVAMGFNASDFVIAARPLPDLSTFRVDRGRSICTELQREFAQRTEHCEPGQESFALLLIDGMCQREETIMSAIYASLEDIPMVGGSAGDGMRFEKSWVFHGGRAHTDAAVLILIKTRLPFRLFKCDHFEPTSTKMVVTEADIEHRIVKEINAEPAALEYSRAVGISETKLDPFSFAAHPVLVRVGGAYYARSIQRMDPDGSLQLLLRGRRRHGADSGARARSGRGYERSAQADHRRARRGLDLHRLRMRAAQARCRAAPAIAGDVGALSPQQCDWLSDLWRAISLHACQSDADRRRHRQAGYRSAMTDTRPVVSRRSNARRRSCARSIPR